MIYLKASVPTLVSQIQKRGREYEENIRLDYLKRLNDYYNKWIDNYSEGPLLVIDCDKIKFGESGEMANVHSSSARCPKCSTFCDAISTAITSHSPS